MSTELAHVNHCTVPFLAAPSSTCASTHILTYLFSLFMQSAMQ